MNFDFNPNTDVYLLQNQRSFPTSDAHYCFSGLVKLLTSIRLRERTDQLNDGTYYSLNKGMDKAELMSDILKNLDARHPGNRFLWKNKQGEIVVLDRSNGKDMKTLGDRIWTRILASRVDWVKDQDRIKDEDMRRTMRIHNEINGGTDSNNVNASGKNTGKKKRGRPFKHGIPKTKRTRRGRPPKNEQAGISNYEMSCLKKIVPKKNCKSQGSKKSNPTKGRKLSYKPRGTISKRRKTKSDPMSSRKVSRNNRKGSSSPVPYIQRRSKNQIILSDVEESDDDNDLDLGIVDSMHSDNLSIASNGKEIALNRNNPPPISITESTGVYENCMKSLKFHTTESDTNNKSTSLVFDEQVLHKSYASSVSVKVCGNKLFPVIKHGTDKLSSKDPFLDIDSLDQPVDTSFIQSHTKQITSNASKKKTDGDIPTSFVSNHTADTSSETFENYSKETNLNKSLRIPTHIATEKGNSVKAVNCHKVENAYNMNTSLKTIKRSFKLKLYESPGDGNCGIQSIMHHLNIENKMSVDIHDLENVALFRRYLCYEVMKIFIDETITHPNDMKATVLLSLSDESSVLFNGLYSIENHEKYTSKGRLAEHLWLDHQTILPLISFVLKKSICVAVSKHGIDEESYRKRNNYISFIHFDPNKPNQISRIRDFNEVNDVDNEPSTFDVHHFPNTMFLAYEHNQHYDVFVSSSKSSFRPFYCPGGRATRSTVGSTATNFSDTPFVVNCKDFTRVRKEFDALSD